MFSALAPVRVFLQEDQCDAEEDDDERDGQPADDQADLRDTNEGCEGDSDARCNGEDGSGDGESANGGFRIRCVHGFVLAVQHRGGKPGVARACSQSSMPALPI